ncbi:LADA_0D06392g1_1 [Lachancea dasiensis]|uniref:LADA_0D06392g1_1 n=1 Tax=Lachancea dasiensis TaxID=1072105 RepID=A0A1G4J5X3_9SACH|nr:LADA_0D06392g1_1 [Lachancea dasiensis]
MRCLQGPILFCQAQQPDREDLNSCYHSGEYLCQPHPNLDYIALASKTMLSDVGSTT